MDYCTLPCQWISLIVSTFRKSFLKFYFVYKGLWHYRVCRLLLNIGEISGATKVTLVAPVLLPMQNHTFSHYIFLFSIFFIYLFIYYFFSYCKFLGNVWLSSSGGDVVLGSICGQLTADLNHGSIEAKVTTGGNVDATTSKGGSIFKIHQFTLTVDLGTYKNHTCQAITHPTFLLFSLKLPQVTRR